MIKVREHNLCQNKSILAYFKQNAELMMINPRTVLKWAISLGLAQVTKILISRGASMKRAMESQFFGGKYQSFIVQAVLCKGMANIGNE